MFRRATMLLAIVLGAWAPIAVSNAFGAKMPVAAADGLPKVDIQNSCRESSDALYGSTTANVYDSCMEAEKDAGAKLAKGWSTFPAADKAHCVHVTAFLPSYVEWLTCIEGESTLRQIRKDNSAGAPPG
jgi:hypothetical protein